MKSFCTYFPSVWYVAVSRVEEVWYQIHNLVFNLIYTVLWATIFIQFEFISPLLRLQNDRAVNMSLNGFVFYII